MGRELNRYRDWIAKASGRRETLQDQLDETQVALQEITSDGRALERVQVLVQRVAQQTQEQLRYHIEDLVQLALDTCFPGRYVFRVVFEIKRGKTEAMLSLLDDGNEISPMDASGGGVVDITSFALRIAAWTLGRTGDVIVLDEPFRFLSRELRPLAAEIVRELSRKLSVQFIIITHAEEHVAQSDRVFSVLRVNDRSQVRQEEV